MNDYSFTGRLARDCNLSSTQNGSAVCSFTVAVDFGYGEHKGTNWIRCSVFGKRAEGGLPQYLMKGAQVGVSGELRISEYTDRDGAKRTSVDVNVNQLDLLGSRSDGLGGQGVQGQHAQGQSSGPTDQDVPF